MSIPDRRGVRTNAANIVRLETAQSTEEIREAILGYLRAHRNWYQKWSTRYAVSWNLLTFLILTLGALTSILTAIGNVDQRILIGLPALSSLCAALLIQFRLKESCKIRDHGRIAVELLICKAQAIQDDDVEKARRSAIKLRESSHRIELDQLAEFTSEGRNRDEDGNGT